MNLDFLDEYWNIVGSEHSSNDRKHFEPLTNVLLKNNSLGILKIKFQLNTDPGKNGTCISSLIALEYKSITSKSIEKCKYLRVEEALGSILKKQNSNYRLDIFEFENDRILSAKKVYDKCF